jgi:flagellar motor switch protein FliN/FliY
MSDSSKPFTPEPVALAPDGSFATLLQDVPLEITVELGRTRMNLRELSARLGPGSVISLSKMTGEKLDVRVNDRLVARGEAVAVGDRFGIRITEIIRADGTVA